MAMILLIQGGLLQPVPSLDSQLSRKADLLAAVRPKIQLFLME
jgi:hypothetical protein